MSDAIQCVTALPRYEKAKKERKSFVYAITTRNADFVKVGYSCAIEKRIRAIQTGCPFRVVVSAALIVHSSAHGYKLEESIHSHFRTLSIQAEEFAYDSAAIHSDGGGEWLRGAEAVLDFFDAIGNQDKGRYLRIPTTRSTNNAAPPQTGWRHVFRQGQHAIDSMISSDQITFVPSVVVDAIDYYVPSMEPCSESLAAECFLSPHWIENAGMMK